MNYTRRIDKKKSADIKYQVSEALKKDRSKVKSVESLYAREVETIWSLF